MAAGEPIYADPTFWVGCSFIVFVGGLIWLKVHKSVAAMLDAKSEEIRKQIDEARSLSEEASQLLTEYQRKQRAAEQEAADILAQAEGDAKILVKEAKKDIAAMSDRRAKAAEEKIRQAEASAIKEVKALAADIAVQAATAVLAEAMKGKGSKALTDASIAEVEQKLH